MRHNPLRMPGAFAALALGLQFALAHPVSAAPKKGASKVEPEPEKPNMGAFLEPLIGLSAGSFSDGVDSTSAQGLGLGTRLGLAHTYYFIAADVEYALLRSSLTSSLNNLQVGITAGGTIGPFPLRIYAGINILDSLSADGTKLEANGGRLGLGYFITSDVSLNVESQFRGFAKKTVGSTQIQPTYNNFLFSVSFPIGLGIPSPAELASETYKKTVDRDEAWGNFY